MSDTSLAFNFLRGRDTASPHMKKVGDEATRMGGRIKASSVISVAATATMVAGWASLAAHGVAAVAAVSPLIGLLAAVPAVTIAAAGGIGTLVMGFSGLGAALKQTAGGASGASGAIAAAERRVESAQRSAATAQLDLNAAREEAADRLIELSRLLARAALDEEAATLGVADAQRQLREARQSGDRSQVQHADLGLRQAKASLEDVKLRTQELREEETQRTASGVEGSNEVLTALQRQADAMRDLAEAQTALKTAGTGGGGVDAAAVAYGKLSQAGRDLVDTLKAIAPSWRGVQQAVQQSMFQGVAGDVRKLSDVYLPVMSKQLPAIGRGWNIAFRDTAALASSAGFVADVNTSLGHTATFWQRIGASAAPFLNGFNQFITVGSSFLPGIGSWVERGATAFEKWAIAARESGRAQAWMSNALTALSQLWEIAKNLGGSIVAIFKAGDAGPGWLPGLVAGTQSLQTFLESPAGQGKIAEVFSTLRNVGSQLWSVLTNVGPALAGAFTEGGAATDTLNVFGAAIGFAADHLGTFTKYLPLVITAFIAYKAITAGAIVLEAIRIPLLIAQTISNFALASAMRATTVATGTQTVAQWGLNTAMLANPIGLIIIAIVALVAGIWLLWNNSEGFRLFFIGMWNGIKAAFWAVVDWIGGRIVWLIDTVTGIRERISSAAGGLWDGLVASFKSAVNWMIRLWNDFHLTIGGGTILGISIPSVTLNTPDIPMLAAGGIVPATPGGRLAILGEGGQDEAVIPLPRNGGGFGGSGGKQEITVRIVLSGPEEVKRLIRKITKDDGGGNVQIAFGT